ncbi:MAG: hypothetical protein HY516_03245 [Candidatus Aenigmarchaeota archaeon]|nr:hypothetical protein [Candidatus Aenigmarchaeota archaeon]
MPKVSIDLVTNHFEGPESPWTVEQQLVDDLFKKPSLRLTAAIFGIYPHTELPYWDFKADARRHAIRCVQSGTDERDAIAGDYDRNLWAPSKEIILDNGEYDAIVNELIDGLPFGPSKVSYAHVIRKRYGFEGKPTNPKALSNEFQLTTGRIRDLEGKALRILRHPSRSNEIKSYLEERRWVFVGR